ncbi:hypothetical protein M5689_012340 [Euphorbia peplus]|nr:hypothetical protein M5689_012340 [Euphorbia peplus]
MAVNVVVALMDSGGTRSSETAATPSEPKGRKGVTEDADSISKLPDELLHQILSYDSIRNLASFSQLSYKHELDFGTYFSNIKHSVEDIDGWITFALGRRVQSLKLFTYCLFDCCKSTNCGRHPFNNTCVCGFDYLFRTELFYGTAMNLKHLQLSSCELGPNFTNQLSSLETFSLDNVNNLATNLESMFPFLKKLKSLEITSSGLPVKLSLAALPLLQKFSTWSDRQCLLAKIELSNRNLIEFMCLNGAMCNLSGAPNLTSLSYTVPFLEMDSVFIHYPRQCPEVRNLTLVILDNWVNWAPPRHVARFSQVTDLNLNLQFNRLVFSLVRVMAILKAFPVLQRFVLNMNCAKDLEEEEPELSYVPEYLKEITIPNLRFTAKQIKFAIYLLENASALEKMIVLPRSPTLSSEALEETRRELISRLQEVDNRNILKYV